MVCDGPAHGARFDDVGIERALHQPVDVAFFFLDAMSFLVEDGDEFVADDFALLSRDRSRRPAY